MKQMINFRLDSDLVARFDDYARQHGWLCSQQGLKGGDHRGKDTGRSALLVHLVESLVEGRLSILESGPRAFPLNNIVAGVSPAIPATITRE